MKYLSQCCIYTVLYSYKPMF